MSGYFSTKEKPIRGDEYYIPAINRGDMRRLPDRSHIRSGSPPAVKGTKGRTLYFNTVNEPVQTTDDISLHLGKKRDNNQMLRKAYDPAEIKRIRQNLDYKIEEITDIINEIIEDLENERRELINPHTSLERLALAKTNITFIENDIKGLKTSLELFKNKKAELADFGHSADTLYLPGRFGMKKQNLIKSACNIIDDYCKKACTKKDIEKKIKKLEDICKKLNM